MPPSRGAKLSRLGFHPVVLRVAAAAGDEDVEPPAEVRVVEVEAVEAAAVGAVHDRVELPAQPEVQRQLRVGVQRSRKYSACCHSRAVISSFCTLLLAVPTRPSRNDAYWL